MGLKLLCLNQGWTWTRDTLIEGIIWDKCSECLDNEVESKRLQQLPGVECLLRLVGGYQYNA